MTQQNQTGYHGKQSRKSDRGLLIVVLVIFTVAGLGVFGCGGVLVWQFLRPVSTPAADLQTPDEKRAELQAGFSAEDVGVPPGELAELERLFDRFVKAAGEYDDAGFSELVHIERLHEEMHRSGQMPEQLRLFDLLLQESLAEQIWLPVYAARYHIVHVARRTGSDEAVVFVHFWDEYDEASEMRVWVTRDRGRWEFFDWELLQFGMRASREMALYQSPEVTTYNELFLQLTRAERFFERNEYETGAERLRQCEALLPDIPAQLRELARMHVLFYWMAYGYHEEAAELARQAASPTDTPGALYAQIVHHNMQGEHERVLDLCDQYENAIGPGPNSAWYRAEALAGLDRNAEANSTREQYLKWDPDNVEVLAEYALDLGTGEKGRISDLLTRASDVDEVNRTLAERFNVYGDQAGLNAILAHLDRHDADSALVDYINGLLLELQGADVDAADRFLAALQTETDEEARSRFFWSYMACMNRLGNPTAAYDNAPDPKEAFAWLANGDTEEGGESPLSPELLRALVEVHRRNSPEDPWWAYHLGNLHYRDGDFDEALRCYEIGFGNLEHDEYGEAEWALESRMRDCLVAAGRWREAYERGDSPTDQFDALAGELYWRDQFDILRDLVAAHRENHPEDPMGFYYAGQLALRDGNHADAESLLAEAWRLLESEDYRRYQVRTARVNLHIAAGSPLEAYGDVPPDEDTFSQLAGHFRSAGDYDALFDLVKLRRQDAPDDAEPVYQQIQAQFDRQDYEAVLETIAGVDAALVDSIDSYRRNEWEFLHLRSLLRTGRFDAAVDLAGQVSERQADSKALIVALSCSGRNEEAQTLLKEYEDDAYDSVYDDPDAGAILTGVDFREARASAPPHVPTLMTTQLVALLDRPLDVAVAELEPAVTRLLGPDARIDLLTDAVDESVRTFIVSTDRPELLIVCGEGLYQADLSQMRGDLFADRRRWEAVVSHEAWCAFVQVHHGAEGGRMSQIRRMAGELFGNDWLAVWDGSSSRILIPSDGLPEWLLDSSSSPDLDMAGESLWFYRVARDQEREWVLQERIRRLLHAAVREWTASAGGLTLEVVAQIHAQPAAERIRIQVESIRRARYSGWTLTGRLLDDSQFVPWLCSGEPIQLDSSSVMDWTLTGETTTSHARTEAVEWWERTRVETEQALPDES